MKAVSTFSRVNIEFIVVTALSIVDRLGYITKKAALTPPFRVT